MTIRTVVSSTALLIFCNGLYAQENQNSSNPPAVVAPKPADSTSPKSDVKTPTFAEDKTLTSSPQVVPPTPVVSVTNQPDDNDSPRVWFNAEVVLWWMRPSPIPALITTGISGDAIPGALGQPGTRVLLGGNSPLEYGTQPGLRISAGTWLDDHEDLGFEFVGLYFGSNNGDSYTAKGTNLYLPTITPGTGTPTNFIVSDPIAGFRGRVDVASHVRFWGMEGNALTNLYQADNFSLLALAGFRYQDLSESLSITTKSDDLLLGGTLNTAESFRTRNQFYGGQLGLQTNFSTGKLFASIRTTVALGATEQSRDFRGLSSGDSPPAGTFGNGIYVQPTNTGRFTQSDFSVIPQVGLKLGYDILPWMRVFSGYDFLFWSNVIRPGNQIDQTVNFSQSFGGALIGSPRPSTMFRSSDFWSHGVTFGLQMSF